MSFHSLHEKGYKKAEADVNMSGKEVETLHSSTVAVIENSGQISLLRLSCFPERKQISTLR